jgi:hypothetical protein
MNILLVKRIKKINVRADFIRGHFWRSPCGPRMNAQILSEKFVRGTIQTPSVVIKV